MSIQLGQIKTDIAQVDVDIKSNVTANKILKYFENKTYKVDSEHYFNLITCYQDEHIIKTDNLINYYKP
ncbi:hypothetical protein A9Q86_01935 [Flavobacteriales bacterium 33_180_T64]|nr:hypothetical protein A9Q86_01935 [Flavobacteriales bacterium 33_180_T64]